MSALALLEGSTVDISAVTNTLNQLKAQLPTVITAALGVAATILLAQVAWRVAKRFVH